MEKYYKIDFIDEDTGYFYAKAYNMYDVLKYCDNHRIRCVGIKELRKIPSDAVYANLTNKLNIKY